jgi:hypothetical protein
MPIFSEIEEGRAENESLKMKCIVFSLSFIIQKNAIVVQQNAFLVRHIAYLVRQNAIYSDKITF